ncbi:MAG: HisA/HisF-related TIM barrel protein [Candidatus Bathyarchaeia archaeon]
MKIIPVIDVLNGVAVHAVRGKREKYQPLKSVLTNSINPIEVAVAFKSLGFSSLYLADLDAILGKKPDLALYSRIADQTGLNLMVDAGVTDTKTAKTLQNSGVSKIITGTETLKTKTFIKEAVKQLGANHVIASLDMKNGDVLTQPNFDGPTDALGLLKEFKALGVKEFILLDLARVGSREGVNTKFQKEALALLGDGVFVGGGVRSVEDLLALKTLGISGVLLATALHTGKISVDDFKQARLL